MRNIFKILSTILFLTVSIIAQSNEWLVVQKDGPSLPSYHFSKVICDKTGGAWIMTGGVYYFKNDQWKTFDIYKEMYEYSIDMSLDSNNVPWVCTNKAIYHYQNEEWVSEQLPRYNDYEFYGKMIHDKNNNLWLSSGRSLFNITNSIEKFSYDSLSNKSMMDIVYKDDTFFIGSSNDLIKFNNNVFKKYDFAGYKLGFDNEGKLWIAGWNNLYCLENDELLLISDNLQVGSPNVNDILADPSGGVYLATKEGFYSANSVSVEKLSSVNTGLLEPYINSIDIDENGNIFLATQNGLFEYDGVQFKNHNYQHLDKPILASNRIQSIVHTKQYGTLIGCTEGLTKYSSGCWTSLNAIASIFRGENNYNIAIENEEKAWIISSGYLGIFDLQNNSNSLYLPDSLDFDSLIEIQIDSLNNKWITSEHRFFEINANNEQKQHCCFAYGSMTLHPWIFFIENTNKIWLIAGSYLIKYENSLKDTYELSNTQTFPFLELSGVNMDVNNNLWISSYTNGIGIWKNDTIQWQTTQNSGIPSDFVHRIDFEDDNIWCVLDSGIAKYDGQDWHHYTSTNSSLPSDKIYCMAIDQYGNKWIGTNNGLAIFNENGVTISAPSGIDEEPIPTDYELSQNYPNPFNNTTNITFSLPHAGRVKLLVYNILGELVKELHNEVTSAGNYSIPFNAAGLTSGVYIYSLQTEDYSLSKKMVYLK